VITILRGDNKADADEWDLWFGIHCPVDDSNWFRIGVTSLVMVSGVLKFDSDSPLQHQKKTCPIVEMPGSLSTWSDLRRINAYSKARIFGKELI
jgi:hypothetical protein